jgi:TetR/AcrR family transcriptional regulator, cholesterol catabolism regulator
VFNHFPRKDDFLFEWGIRNRNQLHELVATPEFARQPAISQMVTIMRAMADVYDNAATQARVLVRAWVMAGGPILEEPALLGSVFAGWSARARHPASSAPTSFPRGRAR